ncbi:hypothetical protein N7499_003555 [Penicillium canescens]|uniref:Kinesin light chain n=1 Tax=Penicillium canescens TaxID=5083 RepID=A0AAD6IAX4_PENCN|nr:hypothetical protein N7522_000352 [Penicillium canescens]KAJ6038679.1 hypothetical protein N7460_007396 [Penicillium canescens]KAJ6059963.1 hypothetical protein N7444_002895 [Penicillium canescens]KAJ6090841.1 hypothetical protein N7499_003555 [Penicillium canescens]KAJ6175039.1 hypothetical protein N7485_004844 [Penicillium canescens]
MRRLAGFENALRPGHTSTLDAVQCLGLGLLYSDKGMLDEVEQVYMRAIAGYEEALGPDNTSTLNAVQCLGILYRDQGKFAEAEKFSCEQELDNKIVLLFSYIAQHSFYL